MKPKILITDSLFIFKEHEKMLTDAGYEIERLDTPTASEDQLIEAIKGKVGYIIGGIEKTTNKIVDAADALKAMVFTGIGYKEYILNWEYVTKKGIAIANTPDAPTFAVSEWALAATLAMQRNLFDLGPSGTKKFFTTKGIEGQNIGIIGLGRIGSQITKMLQPFRPGKIQYYSRHRHEEREKELGISYATLENLLKESDIVYLCVSKDAPDNLLGAKEFALMKDGSLLVTFVNAVITDENALLKELKSGRLRAASDHPLTDPSSKELPISTWYCSNTSTAFNTFNELKTTSDAATKSLINLLKTGKDEYKVN